MSRGAVDRLAGPMLVFLGVSTIASSALLVPLVSSRRAGEGVKKTQSEGDAVNDRTTMVRCWSCSLRVHYLPPLSVRVPVCTSDVGMGCIAIPTLALVDWF